MASTPAGPASTAVLEPPEAPKSSYGPDIRHGGVNRDGSGHTRPVSEELVAGQNPVDLTARVGS
jgi:hypothetical protein